MEPGIEDKVAYLIAVISENEYPHVTKLAKFKLPNCPTGMFWNTLCKI